ncbi:CU044_5270 family protein [Nonomuraea sp. NPDC050786]|uniref:CU044_5270 family protein n=1 Tax=Nonomuraea sp. NPDC050786 TaxID=3154840 RepID=UPI0033E3D6F8
MGDYSQADLEALRQAWPQPAPPSPDARTAARDALLQRAAATAPRRTRRVRLPRAGRRAVTIGMLAAVLSAVALVVDPTAVEAPRSIVPGMALPAANAQALLGRAAEAAGRRAFTAPRPDQWVYIATRVQGVKQAAPGEVQTARTPLESRVDRAWTRADGKELALYEDGKLVRSATGGGMPPVDYATVAALPTDPDALLAWVYANMGDLRNLGADGQVVAYRLLGSMLAQNLVPPAQEAAVYRAMAKIPGVTVNPEAVDVDGRPAVAVACVEDGWVSHELLLDRATYTYLGERAIAGADHTAPEPGVRVEDGRKIINMGPSYTIKKGTILTLAVRLDIGVTDRPGVRP